MDGHLYVWARRQEVERELIRLALVAEAREALEQEKAGGEHAHGPEALGHEDQPYEADDRQ